MMRMAGATVLSCLSLSQGRQDIMVTLDNGEQAKAYHYTDVWPPVRAGDRVLLNTTAVDLALGTGGFHIVHSVLPNDNESEQTGELLNEPAHTLRQWGHVIKLRYTSMQRSVMAVEEEASPHHDVFQQYRRLEGMPVLIGELHSMLPIALSWLNYITRDRPPLKVVYIQSEGGALPLALSEHVSQLTKLGWLAGTITYGQAYGGELEAVNKFTALIAAKHIMKADLTLITMGPGIVGTGTLLGHSGVEVGELINAVASLGGVPIVMPRISFADDRHRHVGLSHHMMSTLKLIALKRAILPLPQLVTKLERQHLLKQIEQHNLEHMHDIKWVTTLNIDDIGESIALYCQPITTMGRSLAQDPQYFLGVCAAAQVAWEHLLTYNVEKGIDN